MPYVYHMYSPSHSSDELLVPVVSPVSIFDIGSLGLLCLEEGVYF